MQKVVDHFSVKQGEAVTTTVVSVNFVNNAVIDPSMIPVSSNDFTRVARLTMGSADTAFTVVYNFPNPLPEGAKYTRTITGPGGFTDGPFDVVSVAGDALALGTRLVFQAAAAAASQTGD